MADDLEIRKPDHTDRLLQTQIDGKQTTDPPAGVTRVGGKPPQVSGLQLDTQVQGIEVRWNQVPIADLKAYEIQLSTFSSFTSDTQTFKATEARINLASLVAGTVYYVRVRAQNALDRFGDYSAVLNTLTGEVTTADLTVASTQQFAALTITSGFDFLNTNGETQTYGPLTVSVPDANTVVIPRFLYEFDYDSAWGASSTVNNLTIELLRRPQGITTDDDLAGDLQLDFKSTIPTDTADTARLVAPSFLGFDQPGAGVFEYRVRMTVNFAGAGASLTVQGIRLALEFLLIKR